FAVGGGEVVVRLGIVGLELDRAPQGDDRVRHPPGARGGAAALEFASRRTQRAEQAHEHAAMLLQDARLASNSATEMMRRARVSHRMCSSARGISLRRMRGTSTNRCRYSAWHSASR